MSPQDAVGIKDGEVLLRREDLASGQSLALAGGLVPEYFFRVKLLLAAPEAVYREADEERPRSSNLFWEEGRPGWYLLRVESGPGRSWSLSFTPWGKLRWEMIEEGEVTASVESSFALGTMVDLSAPFFAGVVIDGQPGRGRVCLLVGESCGCGLLPVAEGSFGSALPIPSQPALLTVGEEGATAVTYQGLLVANSLVYALFDDPGPRAALAADFPGGSGRGARLTAPGEATLRPTSDFGTTRDCSWYFFRVDDPEIRLLRLERINGMSPALFVSYDRTGWERVPLRLAGRGEEDAWQAVARLPERAGPVYVATSPVYAELECARDLERCTALGCSVERVGLSSMGLPIHLVTLTDPAVALKEKLGVVLLCGQHSPMEQMGGQLGLPCIEQLVEMDRREGGKLLSRLVFYWIPIFNVDCARYVSSGVDARLRNPNRCWFSDQGPEQLAVEEYFLRQQQKGLRLALFVDVHGGGGWNNHTILGDYAVTFERDPRTVDLASTRLTEPDTRKAAILDLMDKTAGLHEVWHNGMIDNRKARAPEWFQEVFSAPAITIELSGITYRDPQDRRTKPLTHASLLQLGRDLGRSFAALVAP